MSITASSELTAEQISAAAYAEPPITPNGLSLKLIVVVIITIVLATFVIALRAFVRIAMKKSARGWAWEDTFAVLAWASLLCSVIFAVKAAFYGLGARDSRLNELLTIRCGEYLLYSQLLYGLSMPLIKASVVFTLLRFTNERRYRWTLYAMQLLATTIATVGILASLLYCKPIQAYWNIHYGTCGDFMVVVRIGYAWTAISIATDWCCSLLPWFIVRKLQMSKKTKITVMIILGVGSVASTASIVRATYLRYYLEADDRFYWNAHIILWCILESGIGIIAASLPALRSLFVTWLDASRTGSNNRSNISGRGSKNGQLQDVSLRTIGGGRYKSTGQSQSLDKADKKHRPKGSIDRKKPLADDASSKAIIMRERTIHIDTESLSDQDAGGEPWRQGEFAI